ncbi:MAG: hypothetical protein R2685_05065 [Candidatus Nitrosocosmicus sp.]|nr:hypothetical protein [Candidatus Nitrosocosmicus sp.]
MTILVKQELEDNDNHYTKSSIYDGYNLDQFKEQSYLSHYSRSRFKCNTVSDYVCYTIGINPYTMTDVYTPFHLAVIRQYATGSL